MKYFPVGAWLILEFLAATRVIRCDGRNYLTLRYACDANTHTLNFVASFRTFLAGAGTVLRLFFRMLYVRELCASHSFTTSRSICFSLMFLTFSVLVAKLKKVIFLRGGPSRSWSAEQGNKEKVWQYTPTPTLPRCSFGENKIK